MRINGLKITSGPNIGWYIATILFFLFGGWRGLLIWFMITIFIIAANFIINKELRDALFKKGG